MIEVHPDPEALAEAAAARFAAAARAAIATHGRFAVALAGGHTPAATYRLLAASAEPAGAGRAAVDWSRVHLFWGDERAVPPDHPDSNYRMVRETLLAGAPVPAANVHPVPTGLGSAEASAAAYEETLERWFGLAAGGGPGTERPRFDLVLLGLGEDGHTASLMPGCPALAETARWVATCAPQSLPHPRITLTLPAINAGRRVVFLVAGAAKAPALARVLEGDEEPGRLPAAGVRPGDGELRWLVDRAAAGRLRAETLDTTGRAYGAAKGTAS